MYSKQEASQLRHGFWTTFGKYMRPVFSSEGEKINWINYKTGEKNIGFRMQATNKTAVIEIELSHSDAQIQQLYFEQLLQLKNVFDNVMKEEWMWQSHIYADNGKTVSRIYKEKTGLSIFRKQDWPELISFFKPRIIALDEFWSSVKYIFEALR
jgi:hypothetical protein